MGLLDQGRLEADQVFGRLTLLKRFRRSSDGFPMWECVCVEGNKVVARESALKSGNTKSCGCLKANNSRTHGLTGTRLHRIWKSMIQRCENPRRSGFPIYGGRGIRVCEGWRNSFEVFYGWALRAGYDDALTIDRIDNDGPYSPGNCRWVTRHVQRRNSRQSLIFATAFGETKLIADWTRDPRCKVKARLLYTRFHAGMPFEVALRGGRR